MKVVLAQIKGRNWWTWAWVPDEHPSCQVTEQQVFWRPTSPGGDSHIKAKGPLRRGWNTKHYIITTIRRTAAHLYHTMNHHRVQLPHGASITWCTYHTLHGSRFLNYLTVHRPKFFTYHKVHLSHGAPTRQCADPSTSCTYHTVILSAIEFFSLLLLKWNKINSSLKTWMISHAQAFESKRWPKKNN